MKKIFNFIDAVIETVYPERCICCGEIIPRGTSLCKICSYEVPVIDPKSRCLVCGLHKPYCRCKNKVFYFEECVGVFENLPPIKDGYYRYKIGNRQQYSTFFASRLAQAVRESFGNTVFDAVCSVPQSFVSRISRGFDHAGTIAQETAEMLGLPYRRDIIGVKPFKYAQHTSSYKQRSQNVRGKYYIKGRADRMNILLIDDIRTSGSTLNECSHMLLLAGAESVRCATALVTVPKHNLKNGDIKNGN